MKTSKKFGPLETKKCGGHGRYSSYTTELGIKCPLEYLQM